MTTEHSTRGNFVSDDNGINMVPIAPSNSSNDEDDDLYKFDPDKEPWWNRWEKPTLPMGRFSFLSLLRHNLIGIYHYRYMLEYTLPAGFNKVESSKVSEVLSLSGSRSAMYFFGGDKIECSDEVVSQERTVTRNGKEEKMPIYYLMCRINEGAPKAVPFASFRRFPKDVDTILNKSKLMRDLFDGSDSQRFDLIKGKKLEVIGIEEGEAIDWTKSNLDTREFVYKKAKFPVLDYAK